MAGTDASKFALKSVTIIGLIVLILSHFLPDLPVPEIENIADNGLKIVGAVMVLYGRWRKGDLTLKAQL